MSLHVYSKPNLPTMAAATAGGVKQQSNSIMWAVDTSAMAGDNEQQKRMADDEGSNKEGGKGNGNGDEGGGREEDGEGGKRQGRR